MRTLILLTLLAAASPASITFGPGNGATNIGCTVSGGIVSGAAFAVASGNGACQNPGPLGFSAAGVAIGTATGGPMYVGWDLTGPVSGLDVIFTLNSLPIFQSNNVALSGMAVISGPPPGTAVNSYEMRFQTFAGAPNSPYSINRMFISEIPFGDGSNQNNPLPPNGGSSGNWIFSGFSGRWYDPPLVDGFDYTGTGGTTFTQIGLPTGFASNFVVSHGPGGGTVLGTFGGGTLVDFVALTGGAVNSFRITGIAPLVDAANPNAFPLQVFFSNPTGSFTQSALVPEPGTNAMIGSALIALGWLRRRYTCRTPNEPNQAIPR